VTQDDGQAETEDTHLTGRRWYRHVLLPPKASYSRSEQEGCNGALRDTIVHFGEGFEAAVFDEAVAKSQEADLALCLGSSCLLMAHGDDCLFHSVQNRLKALCDTSM